VGNDEGNKVTYTIFTGSRKFIMVADSGEIISQNPELQSVLRAGLNKMPLQSWLFFVYL
jgi:hypothetical protein